MSSIEFPYPNRKQRRAEVIADYITQAGYRGCVCFSCGHASAALKETGVYVVDISPTGPLVANRWWTHEEIHRVWPDLFDATSGHLPLWMMLRIAQRLRPYLGASHFRRGTKYRVPTGSGETILCLRWAFPGILFTPVYDCGQGTEYHPEAPLNALVAGNTAFVKRLA